MADDIMRREDDEEDDTTDDEEEEEEEMDETTSGQRVETIISYDTSLPSQHNYLGEDLLELSGRVLMDDLVVTLPLLTLEGVILMPGQVLPLQLHHPSQVSMMHKLIRGQRTVGVLSYYEPSIGTTAEIRSYSAEDHEEEGLPVLRVKAEGRQRFRVVEKWRQDGVQVAKVAILPDLDPICSPNNKELFGGRWPAFVYRLYDPKTLMQRLKTHLKSWTVKDAPTEDPKLFSYWVAANLPLNDQTRSQLLQINSSVQRMRFELSLLDKYAFLCCCECKARICLKNDVIQMSASGPQGTYVNPHGCVHEMVTLGNTENIDLVGIQSTDFSWFPGYAWTICRCMRCNNHLGWKFSAVNKKLRPEWFWGLRRSSLEPGFSTEDMAWKPCL